MTFYVQASKPGNQFYTLCMLQMKMKSCMDTAVMRTDSLLLASASTSLIVYSHCLELWKYGIMVILTCAGEALLVFWYLMARTFVCPVPLGTLQLTKLNIVAFDFDIDIYLQRWASTFYISQYCATFRLCFLLFSTEFASVVVVGPFCCSLSSVVLHCRLSHVRPWKYFSHI